MTWRNLTAGMFIIVSLLTINGCKSVYYNPDAETFVYDYYKPLFFASVSSQKVNMNKLMDMWDNNEQDIILLFSTNMSKEEISEILNAYRNAGIEKLKIIMNKKEEDLSENDKKIIMSIAQCKAFNKINSFKFQIELLNCLAQKLSYE